MTSKPKIAPTGPDTLYGRARTMMAKKDFPAAKDLLLQSLKEEKTAESQCALGEVYVHMGRVNEATIAFEAAIKTDPAYDRAYGRLAELLILEGHIFHAMEYYGLAIGANPEDLYYKQIFLSIANTLHLKSFNPGLKKILLECLQTEQLNHAKWPKIWMEMLARDPLFKAIFKAVGDDNRDTYEAFRKTILANRKPLFDPFFLECLRKVIISSVRFEKFFTYLRRFMLEQHDLAGTAFPFEDYLAICVPLSYYCLRTDYVFEFSEAERQKAEELKARAGTADPHSLCILGCYLTLSNLPEAAAIASRLKQSPLAAAREFAMVHIDDYLAQRKIRETIPALTKIKDKVSSLVREQYEEFPYPQWTNFSSTVSDEEMEGGLRNRKARILVAGCGTGREAIELAAAFPDATVLAVDLSLTSLSYAIKKARDGNINNVDFRQADILELGSIEERFDYIASAGVLHHMQDPAKGLEILTGLLKPEGLMRLGLYSQLARQCIDEGKQVIREKGYPATAEGIRHFRKEAPDILTRDSYKKITNCVDYFSLPECRDLLFHVQEQRFTMPQLKEFLDREGLEFLKFYHHPGVFMQYRKLYPDDKACRNLDLWDAFEQKNPDTFIEMYRFWCRRKQ